MATSNTIAWTNAELSAGRQQLVETMRVVKFGRIENCVIRDGEPVFDPAPRITRDIKLGSGRRPVHRPDEDDFELKAQVVDLFEQLDLLGTGIIESLEIQHGLPFKLVVRHPL